MSAASREQQEPELPNPTPVAVADLIVGGISTRARGIDPKWVKQLVATGADWPPILITRNGIVLDGQHRVLAAQELKRTHITARTFTGGETSAELLEAAAAGNAAHGMPLTTVDRRAIVERLLRLAPEWSDRRIAVAAGVSPTTVGRCRRTCDEGDAARTPDGAAGVQSGHLAHRIGRDGKRYPVEPSKLGRNGKQPDRGWRGRLIAVVRRAIHRMGALVRRAPHRSPARDAT